MTKEHSNATYDPELFHHELVTIENSKVKSLKFYEYMDKRRSIRFFKDQNVPFEIIENIIKTANTAPSGAHQQPWTFVVVKDPEIKKQIRIAAEKEEKFSYETRMTEEWKKALEPIGTGWRKTFLETVPYLIIVFKQRYGLNNDGSKKTHYYVNESVGIAVGFLIAAIHNAGLVTLTHTPSPMKFLSKILDRPENEVPFILLPIGYPAKDATVPNLTRKSLDQVMVIH
ncbi:MAG: Coenzyme F420:L-glutamate ligase [Candidatus Heimdallarchaeota archaeon LC_2]|nr:MAG: Coenzyme F420:L-glutamate ligase [Candidatus Heimdallarchaeota archaeon LC_2]